MDRKWIALSVAGIATLIPGTVAVARENKVVRCDTAAARRAPDTASAALVANVPRSMTPIDLNAVQMTDKRLTKMVIVEGLFAQHASNDMLQVMARLVNCTDKPLVVQARSSFLDQNQIPTEPSSVWKTVFLSPRATGIYQENSIGRGPVSNYLIELRGDQ